MTTVVAVQAINMSVPSTLPGTVTSASTSKITLVSGNQTGVYTGHFEYFGGSLTGGTVTDYVHSIGGQVVYAVHDAAVDVLASAQATSAVAFYDLFLNGNDFFLGSPSADFLTGLAGDDEFVGNEGNDTIVGGSGRDTATYYAQVVAFTIAVLAESIQLTDHIFGSGTDVLYDIERLKFRDGTIETSWLSKALAAPHAQVVDLIEMYVAYFDRAPDALGLAYWSSRLVEGMTLQQIAKSFFVQPETSAAYPPTMTTTEFVTKVYDNALGRAPDAGGLAYWVHDLDIGAQTRDAFMLSLIYGARAIPGNADAVYLRNKGSVGEYFALTKGLGDTLWAHRAMADVDGSHASVVAAMAIVDQAAADPVPHLVVQLIGIDQGSAGSFAV